MSSSSTSHEAFRSALSTGEINKAIALIEKSSINSRDSGGRTMLHWTALIGGDEIVTELLQHTECDVNAQDGQGQTALHLALSSRHPSIALLLLTHPSISVSHVDHFQRLPLHWVCQHGYHDLLPACIHGVNINAQTQSGDTALHWACTDAHMGCVQQLLLAGARVDIVNQRGQQPWQVTNDENIIQMVKAHLPTSSYMEDDTTSSISSSSSPIISSTPIISTPVNVPLASKPPEKKKMVIKLKK